MKEPFTPLRAVALLPDEDPRHLDHLGVLASYLKIPCHFTSLPCFDLFNRYYPMVEAAYTPYNSFSAYSLSQEFDLLIHSSKQFERLFMQMHRLLGEDTLKIAYCPHGHSDKGYTQEVAELEEKRPITFVYGERMKKQLAQQGRLQKSGALFTLGNYRYFFYLKHKSFYDALVEKEIFSTLDPQKETLLYAPTWSDGENGNSFSQECNRLIKELSPHFNLIIKPHPMERKALVLEIEHQFSHLKNLIFLEKWPLIYPLLSRIAIYVGDFSSVGYDFLTFNRPLYFFNPGNKTEGTALHSCGMLLSKEQSYGRQILKTRENNQCAFEQIRKEVYAETFGTDDLTDQVENFLSEYKKSLK